MLRNKARKVRSNVCLALGCIMMLLESQSESPEIPRTSCGLLPNMSIKEMSSADIQNEVLISMATGMKKFRYPDLT